MTPSEAKKILEQEYIFGPWERKRLEPLDEQTERSQEALSIAIHALEVNEELVKALDSLVEMLINEKQFLLKGKDKINEIRKARIALSKARRQQ